MLCMHKTFLAVRNELLLPPKIRVTEGGDTIRGPSIGCSCHFTLMCSKVYFQEMQNGGLPLWSV